MATKTIKVDYLARVEGEGGLYLRLRNGQVVEARLDIFEPPRFFEAFLRGRAFTEVPDITARICGICPVAYQMSSTHAIEAALGIRVTGPLRDLRRLLYCGQWIESHALHVYMLHAPDFLGYDDALKMARDHPRAVERGLRLKKIGNEIVRVLAGREIHPVNVAVGGFYRAPSRRELQALADDLKWGLEAAYETVRWVCRFDFPEFERDYEFVALRHPDEYPLNEGRVVSNKGLDIEVREYEEHFVETQVSHSSALHSSIWGRGEYLCGPLARLNLNADRLSPLAREAVKETGLALPWHNPFLSIVARSVEMLFAFEEALRLVSAYEVPDRPRVDVPSRPAQPVVGHGCTEAPRGLLYHRYRIGSDGLIEEAKIVPPTAQNLACIEQDLRALVPRLLDRPRDELTWKCEQAIRNYDPCISCATHFLTVTIDEGGDT